MKKGSTTWTRWFANILFAVLIAAVSRAGVAQTTTGSIYGSVTDNTGGVLPKAAVTVTNVQTGLIHTTQSNDGGDYTFPALDPGDYSISARFEGFNVERNKVCGWMQTRTHTFRLRCNLDRSARPSPFLRQRRWWTHESPNWARQSTNAELKFCP